MRLLKSLPCEGQTNPPRGLSPFCSGRLLFKAIFWGRQREAGWDPFYSPNNGVLSEGVVIEWGSFWVRETSPSLKCQVCTQGLGFLCTLASWLSRLALAPLPWLVSCMFLPVCCGGLGVQRNHNSDLTFGRRSHPPPGPTFPRFQSLDCNPEFHGPWISAVTCHLQPELRYQAAFSNTYNSTTTTSFPCCWKWVP